MCQHTPGPWHAALGLKLISDVYAVGVNGQRVFIAECATQRDALLIAAAPAMYEALLSILPATDIVGGQETDNCRWCGRDYTDHAVETGETLELCSSDDCPGYIARAALAQAERGTI